MQVRPVVQWFAEMMEKKLQENDHKAHWSTYDVDYLMNRVDQETNELDQALTKVEYLNKGHEEVIFEAADVANMVMFIADKMRINPSKDRRE